METMASRARSVLFEPRTTFREVESEFTKPGAIWGKYILPLAAIGPIAGAIGRLVFGQRIALTTLTSSVSTQVISLLAPGFGGQKNDVQALKVAAYASTPVWLAGAFSVYARLVLVGVIVSAYSLFLLYVGLPILMKVPQDRSMGYTAVVIIAAVVIFLLVSTYTLF